MSAKKNIVAKYSKGPSTMTVKPTLAQGKMKSATTSMGSKKAKAC